MKNGKIKRIIFLVCTAVLLSCHDEGRGPPPAVERLVFAEKKKVLEAGQRASVGITIEPKEARGANEIKYRASKEGVIEIDYASSSKEGVVFNAVYPGSTVVVAKSAGVVDYCDVIVTGETEITIPYISVNESVVEIPVGEKKYISAALQGGSPADQNNFSFTNSDDHLVYMDSANNTAVLEGLKKGVSRITVNHPKAQYNVSIVVFVLNEGEVAKYITGDPAVFMELGGSTREYGVRLVGVNDDGIIGNTIYQVTEGTNIIEVTGMGAVCTIRAKSAGIAKVRVTNQFITEYQFEFQVMVSQKNELKYIKTKNNFYIIEDSDFVNFTASMEGDVPNDWDQKFNYTVNNEGIIHIEYVQGNFIVSGIKNGTAVLSITNQYSGNTPCEILFVVQNRKVQAAQDGLYIRTSQSVIQMEAGKNAPDAILKMELVGGTSADQNNFEWVVEDSSIIEVNSNAGKVTYRRSQVNTLQSYEAESVITAKRPGTTRITVYNNSPNCVNSVTVMVKVYPYGTFNGQAIYVGGPSIIRLEEGKDADIYTPVIGGNAAQLGNTVWESLNPAVMEATGSGLHGNVKGVSQGLTRLRVSGENIAQDFECAVVVYREEEENNIPYIYTDNIIYRLVVGQTARIPVRHPNIPQNEFNFTVNNTNKQAIYHVVSGDVLIVNGYEPGAGELIIKTDNPDCNEAVIYVTVENEQIDMTCPYSLTGVNYKGMEEGDTVTLSVEMIGAGANELKNILWNIDDEGIAKIKGRANNEVQIEGVAEGQTVLRVNHAKSVNEKAVILYVVKKGQQVEGKIIIGIEKQNYLINKDESVFLRLLTNAGEEDKKLFSIRSVANAQNIHIDFNYDSLVVTGVQEGNSRITIWCYDDTAGGRKNLIDLDIYITVREEQGIQAEVGFPDSVVLVKDQYKAVKGSSTGIMVAGLNVDYTFEDNSIASISGMGLDVVFKGLNPGQTYVQVSCPQINFYKKVLVICVGDEEELETLYYFTVPKSLYRIKENEEIKISLGFGENGSPPDAVYEWKDTNSNDSVTITRQGTGKSAVIRGKNQGQAVVAVTCATMPNIRKAEIIIEVSDNAVGQEYYRFGVESAIEQMSLANESVKMVPVSIYYGSEYYDDYDVLHPGRKMETGYNGIEVSVSDTSVIQAAMGTGSNSQFLRVSAVKAGKSEINLHHDMIETDAKLLVVVYEGEVPQGIGGFVFYAAQKHYLINKDETREIQVQTTGTVQEAQGKLVWENQSPDIFSLSYTDKTKAQVTGLKAGSGSLILSDDNGNTEKIFVSVSTDSEPNNVSVATESIIILSLEENTEGYLTKIIINGNSQAGAHWESKDEGKLEITGSGNSCMLFPKETGSTELQVRGNGFEKTIAVKILETEEEKAQAKVMNIDQRKFKLRKGETVIISPYYKTVKPASLTNLQAGTNFDNKVIAWEKSSKGITVTAKNIGIQNLDVWTAGYENTVPLNFEVDESLTGHVTEVQKLVYMTTDNPVIILEPGYNDFYTEIKVIGEYAGSDKDFTWAASNSKIKLNSFGTYSFISVAKGEYTGTITVRNEYCTEKTLTINVIVGSKYAQPEMSDPYMYTEKNVYTMNKTDSTLLIPLEIRNVPDVNYSEVHVYSSSYAANCSFANGIIIVNAVDTGSAVINITYKSLNYKIYVIVQEILEGGAVFLTTAQNYVIVNVNQTQAINVDLVNYHEIDSSRITWKSGNTNVAHVIGSGISVQVLGVGAGFTKLTVKHAKSFNDLEIVVKVLPSGANEDICYLTTADNVIETYISTNSRQVAVTKVGGRSAAVDAIWTVDNPSLLGVMGQNDIAYITAKKAGIAKITVSDKEAGNLDIVVIVREARPGDLFIVPNLPIVQIKPGSTNGVLSVAMPGIDASEEKEFKWQIYSQMPSDINVARNGGSVVSIYSMGTRCTVNGIYAGTARIKVTHPKAAEAAYIIVQVTNFETMRFVQQRIIIVKNDMAYVVLETPDYENFIDKVSITSDNPAVASVIGTHRVALISARDITGTAMITALVKDTGLKATVEVTVVDEQKYNEPEIVTNQTMFILNSRELPFTVNARIMGFGIQDTDSEDLVWTLNYQRDEDKAKPIIKIYPENTATKGFASVGKEILVEVQQYSGAEYTGAKYCTLTITHPATSRQRVLYFQVQEDSNVFTISKRAMLLESGEDAELTCNILNGTSKDYEQVVWEARKDSADPSKDIVKVIGRGKRVQVLGMTDGQTIVTASYWGINSGATYCQVTVKSKYYFNIHFQNILVYPGQKSGAGGMFSIGYSVRPVNAPIRWTNTDMSNTPRVGSVTIGPAVDDGTGTGQGQIYFDFEKEGNFTLLGVANSQVSRVDVQCKNIFRFQLDSPGVVYKKPYTESTENNDDWNKTAVKDYGYAVPYRITPAEAAVKLVPNTGYTSEQDLLVKGWDIIIGTAKPNGLSATGYIYIKNRVEGRYDLKFRLFNADGTQVSGEYDCYLDFTSRFDNGYARLIPVFRRVSGNDSNSEMAGMGKYPLLSTQSGAASYAKVYKRTGITGEYVGAKSGMLRNSYNNGETIQDEYNIYIADGERHYILLDKAHPDANIEIIRPIVTYNDPNKKDDPENKYDVFFNKDNRKLESAWEKLDDGAGGTVEALRVDGGNDFVAYTRFGANYGLELVTGLNNYYTDRSIAERHEDYAPAGRGVSLASIIAHPGDVNGNIKLDTVPGLIFDKVRDSSLDSIYGPFYYLGFKGILPHINQLCNKYFRSEVFGTGIYDYFGFTIIDKYLKENYACIPSGVYVKIIDNGGAKILHTLGYFLADTGNSSITVEGFEYTYNINNPNEYITYIKTDRPIIAFKDTMYYNKKEYNTYDTSVYGVSQYWDVLKDTTQPSNSPLYINFSDTADPDGGKKYTFYVDGIKAKNIMYELETYQTPGDDFEVKYLKRAGDNRIELENPLYNETWKYKDGGMHGYTDKDVTRTERKAKEYTPTSYGNKIHGILMDRRYEDKEYTRGTTKTFDLISGFGIFNDDNLEYATCTKFPDPYYITEYCFKNSSIGGKTRAAYLFTNSPIEDYDVKSPIYMTKGSVYYDSSRYDTVYTFNNNSILKKTIYQLPKYKLAALDSQGFFDNNSIVKLSKKNISTSVAGEYWDIRDEEKVKYGTTVRQYLQYTGGYEHGKREQGNDRLARYPFGEYVYKDSSKQEMIFYNYTDLEMKHGNNYVLYPVETDKKEHIYEALAQTIIITYKNQHNSTNTLTLNIYHKIHPKAALANLNRTFSNDSTVDVALTQNGSNLRTKLENKGVLTVYEKYRDKIRINAGY